MLFALILASTLPAHSVSRCAPPNVAYTVSVPGRPFGIAEMPSEDAAFVSVNPETPSQQSGIAVMRCRDGRFLYDHLVPFSDQPTGVAITADGKLLVVADDAYVAFIRTDDAIAGRPALAGFIKLNKGDIEDESAGASFASISPDGAFAFISDENTATVTVINLEKARATNFSRDAIVGDLEVGNAPITSAFSTDGKTMYVTGEIARHKYGFPITCREEGAPKDAKPEELPGVIVGIDVAKAETNPGTAVIGKVPTDCAAVRLSLSPDGKTTWVTNRGSNTLNRFDTEAIAASDPGGRRNTISVGSNPVPVLTTSDGRYVLVGNTNRFGPGGTTSGTISVVDTSTEAVVATLKVGLFPREFDRGFGTTVFLSNNRSDSVTVFDDRTIARCITAANENCLSESKPNM